MGGSISTGKDNDELVDNLVEAEFLKTPALQQVFRDVDRGHYYSKEHRNNAYRDAAWRNGNLHLSAPCVYSEVMEALQLQAGLSFLNLGSGSGYLSTMAGLILGPYGVNHGVEIFEDIVDFAYKKLEEFLKVSEAVDVYQFCQPNFFVGNCLRLDSSCSLYDRVYCGAGCPEEHEMYFRQLLKIGGILVVPLNNKLMQIKRTGESTWESTKVLSVSFAALIRPLEQEPLTFVKLPGFSPPSLQNLCRYKVRTVLKERIDSDHPLLQEQRKHKNRPKGRYFHRIVIPFALTTDSESGNSRSHSDNENNDSDDDLNNPVVKSSHAIIQTLIQTKVILPEAGPSTSSKTNSASSSSEGQPGSETKTVSQGEKNTSKGSVALNDETTESESDMSTDDERSPSNFRVADGAKSDDTEVANSNFTKSADGKRTRKRHASATDHPNKRVRRKAADGSMRIGRSVTSDVIWKRFTKALDSSENEETPEKKTPEKTPKEWELRYSNLMANCIMLLPLPLPLRQFINYRRDIM